MAKNLFVAGLSYETTTESLNKHFSEVGAVASAQVIMDKYTNQSKGFGFVEMVNEEDAKKAIETLNGSSLDNRNIVVKEARPREESGSRYGSGQGNFQRRDNDRDSRNRY